MLKIRPSFLIIILSFLFSACEKEYSIEGNLAGGTALFSYPGSPGACINTNVTGTYQAGTALSTTNTITIDVVVTNIGSYLVSTPVVNGMSFKGSGSFTTTGSQTILLTGSGVPIAPGTFSFSPGSNGCSFAISVDPSTGAINFLSCTIDGTATTFNLNLSGIKVDPTSFGLGGEETVAINTPLFLLGLTRTPAIATGTYNQLSLANPNTFCFVSYDDGVSLKAWETALAGQPGGFSVIVTDYSANRIQGSFSGTLYSDEGLGSGTKVVSGGLFSVPY